MNYIEHKEFKIYNGDCIQVMRELQPESVDFSVFSPPFSSIYSYTNKLEDLGNSTEYEENVMSILQRKMGTFERDVNRIQNLFWKGKNNVNK